MFDLCNNQKEKKIYRPDKDIYLITNITCEEERYKKSSMSKKEIQYYITKFKIQNTLKLREDKEVLNTTKRKRFRL